MCLCSSKVEQWFCKPFVASSILVGGLVVLEELLLHNSYVSFLLIYQDHLAGVTQW